MLEPCFYDVKDYGASGDGKTKDTEAVQNAINICSENGGGYVLLSGGTFCCGTLYFKSGVFLYLASSAVLLASPDIYDYGGDTHYNRYVNETDMDRCFLYGEGVSGIGITGEGVVDGNAECFPNSGSIYRPMLLRFLKCRNIKLKDVRLYEAAAWTTAFLDSEDIWIENLDIQNEKRYNGDGLDFDGCRNVFVSRCKIRGTDDNLCLQASSREYPVENIHISDCHFSSLCAGVRIGLKSVGDIRNVTVTGCTFQEIWREGIKIECTEGGIISDIMITGNIMYNVRRPLFILLNNRFDKIGTSIELKKMPEIGELKRVVVDGLIASDDEEMGQTHYRFGNDIMGSPRFQGIRVDANSHHRIQGLILQNIMYTVYGGVKQDEIPQIYPEVPDYRIENPHNKGSENYYPDWSRTAFMDLRCVDNLILNQIVFQSLYQDERPPYRLENCDCLKEEIFIRG